MYVSKPKLIDLEKIRDNYLSDCNVDKQPVRIRISNKIITQFIKSRLLIEDRIINDLLLSCITKLNNDFLTNTTDLILLHEDLILEGPGIDYMSKNYSNSQILDWTNNLYNNIIQLIKSYLLNSLSLKDDLKVMLHKVISTSYDKSMYIKDIDKNSNNLFYKNFETDICSNKNVQYYPYIGFISYRIPSFIKTVNDGYDVKFLKRCRAYYYLPTTQKILCNSSDYSNLLVDDDRMKKVIVIGNLLSNLLVDIERKTDKHVYLRFNHLGTHCKKVRSILKLKDITDKITNDEIKNEEEMKKNLKESIDSSMLSLTTEAEKYINSKFEVDLNCFVKEHNKNLSYYPLIRSNILSIGSEVKLRNGVLFTNISEVELSFPDWENLTVLFNRNTKSLKIRLIEVFNDSIYQLTKHNTKEIYSQLMKKIETDNYVMKNKKKSILTILTNDLINFMRNECAKFDRMRIKETMGNMFKNVSNIHSGQKQLVNVNESIMNHKKEVINKSVEDFDRNIVEALKNIDSYSIVDLN